MAGHHTFPGKRTVRGRERRLRGAELPELKRRTGGGGCSAYLWRPSSGVKRHDTRTQREGIGSNLLNLPPSSLSPKREGTRKKYKREVKLLDGGLSSFLSYHSQTSVCTATTQKHILIQTSHTPRRLTSKQKPPPPYRYHILLSIHQGYTKPQFI